MRRSKPLMEIKQDPECDHIVLVASWNPKIFTPQWIANGRLTDSANVEVEVLIEGGDVSHRFCFDGISMSVSDRRLALRADKLDRAAAEKLEKTAAEILQTLSQTPLKAVGINFGFNIIDPSSKLLAIFALADNQDWIDFGASTGHITIERSMTISERTVNFTAIHQPGKNTTHTRFNFHLTTSNVQDAQAFLKNGIEQGVDVTNSISHLYELGEMINL